MIGDRDLLVNLMLLLIHDFDLILGMDWLSLCYAAVECFEKAVVFRMLNKAEIVLQGEREIISKQESY